MSNKKTCLRLTLWGGKFEVSKQQISELKKEINELR